MKKGMWFVLATMLWVGHKLAIVAVLWAIASCGKGSLTTPTIEESIILPSESKPFDMLDFVLQEGDVVYSLPGYPTSALPSFLVAPDRYVLCKGGECKTHEAMRFDAGMIYLDEDHAARGHGMSRTYSEWMPRHWKPGNSNTVSFCQNAYYGMDACRVQHGCHNFEYTTTFVEFVEAFDFGGDLGRRDAVVFEYLPVGGPSQTGPEISVYARSAGWVFWTSPEPGAGEYHINWRRGPFKNMAVPKSRWNPDEARTCVWETT